MQEQAVNGNNRWHERYVTLGSLVIAVVVMLSGLLATAVTLSVANEARLSSHEKELAIIRDRQNFVLQKNMEQDDKMARVTTEQHVYLEQINSNIAMMLTRLAVHEADSRADARRAQPR